MTDFVDDKRKEITDRLTKLKPAVDEFNRLEAAASAVAAAIRKDCAAAAIAVAGDNRAKSVNE